MKFYVAFLCIFLLFSCQNRSEKEKITKPKKTDLDRATRAYQLENYDGCIDICNQIPLDHPDYEAFKELRVKSQKNKIYYDKYIYASASVKNQYYLQALIALEDLPEDYPNFFEAINVKYNAGFFFLNEDMITLDPLVNMYGKEIKDQTYFSFNNGVLRNVDFENGQATIVNNTDHFVKPDVRILVLNKDGVTLLEQGESWKLFTLKPGEVHKVSFEKTLKFPPFRKLAFSRWEDFKADEKPAYIIGIGSKQGFERLSQSLKSKGNHKLKHAKYNLKEFLPKYSDFSFNEEIPWFKNDIIESVLFSKNNVRIKYKNTSVFRIKPQTKIYLFNSSGVLLAEVSDQWRFGHVSSGQSRVKRLSFSIRSVAGFELSKYRLLISDTQPCYFYIATNLKEIEEVEKSIEMECALSKFSL